MADSQQDARLFEGLDGPAAAVQAEPAKVPCNLKLRSANREQLKVVTIDVDQLIPPTHKARAIWCGRVRRGIRGMRSTRRKQRIARFVR